MKRILLAALLLLLLFGCSEAEPTPEPEPQPTASTAPSVTPLPPTPSAEPTATLPPTATPPPAATAEPTAVPRTTTELIKEGDEALARSDWETAENLFQSAIEQEPQNALAHARLSYLYVYQPQTRLLAVDTAQQAADLAPDDGEMLAYLLLALNWNNRHEEALALVDQVTTLAYDSPFALAVAAETYLDTGQYDRALSLSQQATALNALRPAAQVYRVRIRLANFSGDTGLAFREGTALINFEPNFAPHYLVQASTYSLRPQGQTRRAELIERGLISDPEYIPLLAELARYLSDTGKYSSAAAECDLILELAPDLPDGHLCHGNVNLQSDNLAGAIQQFSDAAALAPADYRPDRGRGRVFLARGDCAGAQDTLQAAAEKQPYDYLSLTLLGQAEICAENFEAALPLLEQSLALNPYDALTHYNLGLVHMNQEEYALAQTDFLQAIAHDNRQPREIDYIVNLGQALEAQALCPAATTEETTRLLCAANVLLEAEDYASAATAFNEVTQLDNESVEAWEGVTVSFATIGLCEAAETSLERLQELDPENQTGQRAYDEECNRVIAPLEPAGELVGQEKALRMVEAAIDEIEGVMGLEIYYYEIDEPPLEGTMVMVVRYFTTETLGSEVAENQRAEVIRAAAEGFVLSDLRPEFMFVATFDDLTADASQLMLVTRRAAILWYNGNFSDGVFQTTWQEVETD